MRRSWIAALLLAALVGTLTIPASAHFVDSGKCVDNPYVAATKVIINSWIDHSSTNLYSKSEVWLNPICDKGYWNYPPKGQLRIRSELWNNNYGLCLVSGWAYNPEGTKPNYARASLYWPFGACGHSSTYQTLARAEQLIGGVWKPLATKWSGYHIW